MVIFRKNKTWTLRGPRAYSPVQFFEFLHLQLHLESSILVFFIAAQGATLSTVNCNVDFPSLDRP